MRLIQLSLILSFLKINTYYIEQWHYQEVTIISHHAVKKPKKMTKIQVKDLSQKKRINKKDITRQLPLLNKEPVPSKELA